MGTDVFKGRVTQSYHLARPGYRAALAGPARYAEEATEADPSAAHGFAVQRIVRVPRKEMRDRDRAFEPRQRHPGALMRAGAESEMPVRRAADIETFGIGKLGGIAVGGAYAQRHRRAGGHRDAAEF